jgi:dihydroorotate dehydrogenase
VPLIGIGGVTSGETALQKVLAGATLVQLYTGLVYKGPALIGDIKQSLVAALDRAGAGVTLETLRGRDAKSWAARSIEA